MPAAAYCHDAKRKSTCKLWWGLAAVTCVLPLRCPAPAVPSSLGVMGYVGMRAIAELQLVAGLAAQQSLTASMSKQHRGVMCAQPAVSESG